jgi:hypothetical protein
MGKDDSICEIKSIIGVLSPVNSKNEQKVVAIASWNSKEDTLNIRNYNTHDEILLKGIGLNPQEAEKLLYILLESGEVNYDRARVRTILDNEAAAEVIIDKLVEDLIDEDPEEAAEAIEDLAETLAEDDAEPADVYALTHGNSRIRRNGYMRIVPKDNKLTDELYGKYK